MNTRNLPRDQYVAMTQLLCDLHDALRQTLIPSMGMKSSEISVRWDADQHVRNALDLSERTLLACLKMFESLFIEYRHINLEKLHAFSEVAIERIPDFTIVSVNNVHGTGVNGKHATAEISFFKNFAIFTNNNYLPTMTVRQIKS